MEREPTQEEMDKYDEYIRETLNFPEEEPPQPFTTKITYKQPEYYLLDAYCPHCQEQLTIWNDGWIRCTYIMCDYEKQFVRQ